MSDKARDRQGRWRSVTIAFRVSPEENEELNTLVRLSGLTKQDYITCRLLNRDVVVQGNPRVHKALRSQISELCQKVAQLETAQNMDSETKDVLLYLATIYDGLRAPDSESQMEVRR